MILLHLPGRHDATSVAEAMIAEMSKLPAHLPRSITWDRGSELADYVDIQLELQPRSTSATPTHPGNANRTRTPTPLLRSWFEKGSDLSVHTADDLDRIAATLNARPRPPLGLKTPAQALYELLANPPAA